MAWFALAMLAVGLATMLATGWASYAVLLLVASVTAGVGVAVGSVDARLLSALPSRVVGLLENDLLQAVALYALVGALLRHGTLADHAVAALDRVGRALRLAPAPRTAFSSVGLAALSAPMNGSVAASAGLLAARLLPRLQRAGVDTPRAVALTAASATLGTIVPPSLVLLLLGDAMLRAHTQGLAQAGVTGLRIINTQDVVQACAPVALLMALVWTVVALWSTRRGVMPAIEHAAAADAQAGSPLVGGLTILAVAALLVLVALGTVRAVEAAATAAVAAVVHAMATGAWRRIGARVLDDAMTMTGAIFALLVAATTLSLVLRASGCDRLVADGLAHLNGHPQVATLAVLTGLLLLAFVLDAFELVFLVVPIVMPPLLAQVNDAAWVSCLALLTLQAGFLLPPWGYAVVLVRAATPAPAPTVAALAHPLAPYLGALAVVAAVVFSWPQITHWLRSAPERLDVAPTGDRSVDDLIRSMGVPRDDAP